MTIDLDNDRPDWITFDAASKVNTYTLARYWGEATTHPYCEHPRRESLHDLATMSALADVLQSWATIAVHKALLAGASLDEIADATGQTPDQVRERWHAWVQGQTHLWETTGQDGGRHLGVSPLEAEHVGRLIGAG